VKLLAKYDQSDTTLFSKGNPALPTYFTGIVYTSFACQRANKIEKICSNDFQVFASEKAAVALENTPFVKYKTGTLKIVKLLKMVAVASIAIEIKQEMIKHKSGL
jgi:hypothetical protein